MPGTVVVGTQWGDEGKGKIVDFCAHDADVVVRFNGGSNAGHTVVAGDEMFRFHLIPSGILRREKLNLVGNGVVVDPEVLLGEIAELRTRGYPVDNLQISERAHVVMPYHKALDGLEEALKGGLKAGTTMRGIGPTFEDKAARIGLRVGDLLDEVALRERLATLVPMKQRMMEAYGGGDGLSQEELFETARAWGDRLREFIGDTSLLLHQALEEGKEVLFEAAQGTHLDIDHGIYPYGTSSNVVVGAASVGSGVGVRHLNQVTGVVKAFTSRVGTGPFPSELAGDEASYLRDKSLGEYGTTTGRPRRIGWLDLVMVRYSVRINSLDYLAVTKLDVLGGLDPLKVCVAYEFEGEPLREFPASMRVFDACRPVYAEVPGWKDISEDSWVQAVKRGYAELPGEMRAYLDLLSRETGVPVGLVSVGPAREATLDLRGT
ncbi:MAG: adenylosuccinate synthase [Thermoplasmata archaeon]